MSHNSDQKRYQTLKVDLQNRRATITAGTVASTPTKPNEDTYSIIDAHDNLTIAVFDGTTSLKPIADLHGMTGARYASHFLKDHLKDVASLEPQIALLELNKQLLEASKQLGGSLADPHSLPTSIATLVSIKKGESKAAFAHIGDSYGIVYYLDGSSEVFTEDRNHAFDSKIFALIDYIAHKRNITPRLARDDQEVKDALLDMYIHRNNAPDGKGSGLLNGDPNLNLYIQKGTVDLKSAKAILLGSDGLTPPGWDVNASQDRLQFLSALEQGGFKHLFTIKHEAENSDPDWHHIRYKHSDDATGILVLLS